MKKNRLQKDGKRLKCVHKGIVELRSLSEKIMAKSIEELEMTLNYVLLGQQEVHFTLV